MRVVTSSEVLNQPQRRKEWVPIPELGEDAGIFVRAMSSAERDDWEAAVIIGKGKDATINMKNLRARLVAAVAVDEAGKRLFTDEDVTALGDVDAAIVDRPFEVAMKLNRLSAKDVDDLGKASGATQNGYAGAGSPAH